MDSHLASIDEKGFSLVPGALRLDVVKRIRAAVLGNLDILSNTRPTQTSGHVAGFHRFPCFEFIHSALTNNAEVPPILLKLYGKRRMVAIGLSDITVNRSQPWHTDLLRGCYANHLTEPLCYQSDGPPCLKILAYLQDGASLQLVAGSHRKSVNLSSDDHAIPAGATEIERVKAAAGDVVLMDIRTVHRGSEEAELAGRGLGHDAKILISTVVGDRYSGLTRAMQVGNAARLVDWDLRNQHPVGRDQSSDVRR